MNFPLLRGFAPDDVVSWERGRPVVATNFCAAAHRLASQLPRARYAINLCEETPDFLLGTAAALIAGQTLLFPPSRLALPLTEIQRSYPDSYCLTDTGVATDGDRIEVSFDRALTSTEVIWPPPIVDASHVAAILFTSGSTGSPQPHAKTWGELAGGSATLLQSFGQPPRGTAIAGTVAPQHMFGFETTVMLPLQSGTPVLDLRPAYPADLEQLIAAVRERGVDALWLMTTPLQLRAFHRALPRLRGVRRIITATMPLEADVARGVEHDWATRVDEIFGCTEGGILATRRTAETSAWTPAAGLAFSLAPDDRARVQGGHLPHALTLSDRIVLHRTGQGPGGQRFELRGRDHDVVKVAGKRASLAGLTAQALEIAGVHDAAFFVADPAVERLAAIIAAPAASSAEIRAELARRIDPAFMPRPLVIVAALARDASGKAPLTALLRILREASSTPAAAAVPAPPSPAPAGSGPAAATVIEHHWHVAADHPALAGHFPGRPIVPGVVLLQGVEQALAGRRFSLRECVQVKFLTPVVPGTPLSLRADIGEGGKTRFVVHAAGQAAVSGVLVCHAVAGPP